MANCVIPSRASTDVATAALHVERAKGFLAEIRSLSPADLQAVAVTLEAALSSTTGTADTFKVPADSDFAIFQIHGYVRMPTLNTEPTAILSWLNLTPTERWLVKANNCLVKLQNQDRKHDLFDGTSDMPLVSVMPPMGYPLVFPPEAPGLVPASETIRATFTLQDSTTAIVGNASRYGLVLSGVFVPRKA